jgi:hypothetical protein
MRWGNVGKQPLDREPILYNVNNDGRGLRILDSRAQGFDVT